MRSGVAVNSPLMILYLPARTVLYPIRATYKVFQRIVERAGMKHIRLHDLRHTCATLLRKSGQPIEAISKMLGHASVLVTLKIYDHWEGELRLPADAIDQMLEKLSRNQNEGAFVRKTLEEGEGAEHEPCRSRTCDHLIKSQERKSPGFQPVLRSNLRLC